MKIVTCTIMALALSACATFTNPLTINGVYDAEAGLGVLAGAVKAYRTLCVAHQAAVYPKCLTVHPLLAGDVVKAQNQIKLAVNYVRANPGNQVGAQPLLSLASSAIAQLRNDMAANNVTVIGGP